MNIKPSKLERYFDKYEFKTPYLLSSSDCESFTISEILQLEESSEAAFKQFRLGYTEAQGNPELRETIAATLYTDSKPEDVIVCAGAEEAIFIYMNILLKPGDHIIVQSPAYQSLYEIANTLGCKVNEWHMIDDEGWHIDLDTLVAAITPETKALVVNFPHNPTGFHPSQEMFKQIIDIARDHNLYLFCDEVYRCLEYDPGDRLPAASDIYNKAVSLGVMSKAYGLAGLRIGWLVIKDKQLKEAFCAFKDYTTICSSGPSEFLATIALKHQEVLLNRNLGIIKHNLEILNTFFTMYSAHFTWNPPIAGPIAFPRVAKGSKGMKDTESFCLDLIDKTGVLLLPGNTFNCKNANQYIRFGFGRKNMPEVLTHLEEYLENIG
jgi:aspartate/methionine/tyrosine aminotransferase